MNDAADYHGDAHGQWLISILCSDLTIAATCSSDGVTAMTAAIADRDRRGRSYVRLRRWRRC
jgi:hypothetical protein